MPQTYSKMISAERIAKMFSETMGIPCNLDDNFFDLGGDSLMAETVMTTMSGLLGRELELAILLDFQTPEELAEHLSRIER